MPIIILSDGTRHELGAPFTPNIEVEARALSGINRYTGHMGAYSVAQHSVVVAHLLPPELRLAGLLHDLSEAYLGDVSSPLKQLLPEYQALEALYDKRLSAYYGVTTHGPQVKKADTLAASLEMDRAEWAYLETDCIAPNWAAGAVDRAKTLLSPWELEYAYDRFMAAYKQWGGR